MDTAPLKSFATSARTELIREVGARITAVLSQGSPERVEQPRAVTALERAIATGGGGDNGKRHVVDKVAYTWFNRIIALRFMDANGYTGIGVISSATDLVGQPEVLAAAKRGQIDGDVVKGANAAAVTGLLNGTRQPRPGVDAQAEAYTLLLADYCRHWNRTMPFMFEREGDYTELLIPANLLAEDSVLNRSTRVLTGAVCKDVEVIGWLYQFYISERKGEVFAGFKKNKKAGADEIPAATQLFTPHWIVRYLVENSLGRLWMLNHPESRLVDQMDYYIAPVDRETDFLKITKPEELTVIDPACGSGHMLTYAFDLLYTIYEEEGYTPSQIPSLILANNLYGTEIDPRAGALAAFALTMKAAAKRKLFLKNRVEPNICVLDPISFSADELNYLVTKDGNRHAEETFWNQFAEADTFGSLILPDQGLTARLARHLEAANADGDLLKADALDWAWKAIRQAEFLASRYSVVVANPPYMGAKNMGSSLAEYVKREFPRSKADLFAAFIERALTLGRPGSFAALVTMHSWMFLSSFEKLRDRILSATSITGMAHLGIRAFDSIGGAVVATTAFVLRNSPGTGAGVYLRLTRGENEHEKRKLLADGVSGSNSGIRFVRRSDWFRSVPGSLISYWLSDALLAAFNQGRPLAELTSPRNGLQTSDNGKFLRLWWEVSRDRTALPLSSHVAEYDDRRWFPYNKGGDYRRWYGNQMHVVNWGNDGAEIRQSLAAKYPYLNGNLGALIRASEQYGRPHVSWSAVGGGAPSFREYPAGLIFDAAANALFPSSESLRRTIVGVLNSSVATSLLAALAPTLNIVVGDIAKLPIVTPSQESGFAETVAGAVDAARNDWVSFETSWDFATQAWFSRPGRLLDIATALVAQWESAARKQRAREAQINLIVSEEFGLKDEVAIDVPLERVSLSRNVAFRYGPGRSAEDYAKLERADAMAELISYAVGCLFGRYSVDEPGLILGNQGAVLKDYLSRVPEPTLMPDADNVIPIVDGDWFEDDVVGLLRRFLRATFGDQHFEENLEFVTESLGVKSLRDYFITRAGKSKFYDDHIQRYKKRPIYWLFSSPKGSFNALIYMHRYTPSTVSTVLTYLREYVTKLESALQQAERTGNAKEADRLRKILVELNEYEHDTLFPKASENVVIDLDDGVKANYPKFGAALKKIPGLEAASD